MGSEHDVDVVPGLRHDMVHSFDMVVSLGQSTLLYTVVLATLPALSQHDRTVIAQALAATRRPQLVFLTEVTPSGGRAEAVVDADTQGAAAAVGVVRASAGWQSSEPLDIVINGDLRRVTTRWDQRRWQCSVGDLPV